MTDDKETPTQRDQSRRPVGWIILIIAIASVLMQAGWQLNSARELVCEIIFDVVLFVIAIVLLRTR